MSDLSTVCILESINKEITNLKGCTKDAINWLQCLQNVQGAIMPDCLEATMQVSILYGADGSREQTSQTPTGPTKLIEMFSELSDTLDDYQKILRGGG